MYDEVVDIKFNGNTYKCVAKSFNFVDDREIYNIYVAWRYLSIRSKNLGCRGANIPEGLSEITFCRVSGSVKIIKSPTGFPTSFDTYDLKRNKRQEIKSTSVYKDLTSFSPMNRCDELFWIDFYNDGNLNGSFDIYKLDIDTVLTIKVNKTDTFKDAQLAGKRPRFSVREEFINKRGLKPIFSSNVGITSKRFPKIVGKLKVKSDKVITTPIKEENKS